MQSAARTQTGSPPGGGGGGTTATALGVGAGVGAMLGGPRAQAGGGGGGSGGGPPQQLLSGPGGGGGRPPVPLAAIGSGAVAGAVSHHDYALAAAGFGAAGYGIYEAEKSAIDAAAETSHLRAVLLAQGVSQVAAGDLIEQARTIARSTPGLTIADVVKAGIDLKSVLGGTDTNPNSLQPASAALPAFAQTMSLLEAIGNKRGDPTFAAAKAQELLGHLADERTGGVSAEELQRNLDAANRVAIATNMRVGPSDYLAFAKQARIAGISADDEFLYRYAPALIMEMGGQRAGTGVAAFGRQFMAGTMTQNRAEMLKKLGILDKSASWKHGQVQNIPQHLQNSAEAYADPSKWIWDTLKPALEKAGITGRLAQARFISQLASTAVGSGFIASNLTQEASIKKEAANIGAAKTGGAALQGMFDEDFMLQLSNFQKAWHNFMTDMGGPLLEPASALLYALTAGLNQLGQWAHDNPLLAKRIGEVAGAFALFAIGTSAYAGLMFLAGPMIRVAGAMALFGKGMAAATGADVLIGILGRLVPILSFFLGMKPSETNKGEGDVLQRFREMSPEDKRKAMDPSQWSKEHPGAATSGAGNAPDQSRHLWIPGGGDKGSQQHGDVYLDGKKVGQVLWPHLANEISRPASGSNNPDIRQSPLYPGVSGNWSLA